MLRFRDKKAGALFPIIDSFLFFETSPSAWIEGIDFLFLIFSFLMIHQKNEKVNKSHLFFPTFF